MYSSRLSFEVAANRVEAVADLYETARKEDRQLDPRVLQKAHDLFERSLKQGGVHPGVIDCMMNIRKQLHVLKTQKGHGVLKQYFADSRKRKLPQSK